MARSRWPASIPSNRRRTEPAAGFSRNRCLYRFALLIGTALTLSAGTALAQVSAKDGFAPDGSYRWNFELAPYLWLPAASASFSAGPSRQISGGTTVGVPSVQDLTQSLHGAFMGYGLVRYGPFSGELDIQWVDAAQDKTIGPDASGRTGNLSASASYVRLAPGFGYQVYNGALGGFPVTLDARAGFAWFSWSARATSELTPVGISPSGSFIQPWLGLRAAFYPGERWRVQLDAVGQGFGVSGGSWGWGTSLVGTYSVNTWFDVNLGFRALHSSRFDSDAGPRGTGQREFDFTAYGPVVGVGFRF
jgi:hypothetical protein